MSQTTSSSDPILCLDTQARTILEAATSLQEQLQAACLLQPSLSPGGRQNWFDANHLPDLLETRLKLLDATQTMLDLVTGPMDTIQHFAGPLMTKFEVFQTLTALRVAENVPSEGDISIEQLALNLNVHAGILERHLKYAYLMGIFKESRKGYVQHTGISAAMPSNAYSQSQMPQMFMRGSAYVPEVSIHTIS